LAKGNEIIVSSEPRGVFKECIVSGTPKPGTVMQLQAGTVPIAGRFTYEVYNPAADGDPRLIAVLLADSLQGKGPTDAYVSGTRGFLYVPLPGEELNMLVADIAGTGDIHTIGDRLMAQHGTGKLVVQSTSANNATFQCLETVAALTADALLWCMRV